MILEVFLVSLKLGLTSFGGPIAHIGYFHREYVKNKKWIDEINYYDLVSLCQMLPGPASSQLGISIGTFRAGIPGGIVAWFGFTLPSALLMVLFALLFGMYDVSASGAIHGLKLVAFAVVFHAVITMWKKTVNTVIQAMIALTTVGCVWFSNSGMTQVGAIAVAGIFGALFGTSQDHRRDIQMRIPYSKKLGGFCIILFLLLLLLFPFLGSMTDHTLIRLADGCYRSGSLVFGGAHVVLPLLEKEFVTTGLISKESFLAGYGAAQAVPGPLFSFSAYLGTQVSGIPGALVGVLAIFLPGYLLIIGALPFWNQLRHNSRCLCAFASINAAVVGILLAALYHPLWTSTIHKPMDLCIAIFLGLALTVWKLPPILIVILGVATTVMLNGLGLL